MSLEYGMRCRNAGGARHRPARAQRLRRRRGTAGLPGRRRGLMACVQPRSFRDRRGVARHPGALTARRAATSRTARSSRCSHRWRGRAPRTAPPDPSAARCRRGRDRRGYQRSRPRSWAARSVISRSISVRRALRRYSSARAAASASRASALGALDLADGLANHVQLVLAFRLLDRVIGDPGDQAPDPGQEVVGSGSDGIHGVLLLWQIVRRDAVVNFETVVGADEVRGRALPPALGIAGIVEGHAEAPLHGCNRNGGGALDLGELVVERQAAALARRDNRRGRAGPASPAAMAARSVSGSAHRHGHGAGRRWSRHYGSARPRPGSPSCGHRPERRLHRGLGGRVRGKPVTQRGWRVSGRRAHGKH